jgi:hypothetical protein
LQKNEELIMLYVKKKKSTKPSQSARAFSYNFYSFSQTENMERITIIEREGRSPDERETCFPNGGERVKNRGQV